MDKYMLYDYAIKEYELENENGKHKTIYAYFGLAIYEGQVLEKLFTNMLWLKKVFLNKENIKSQKELDNYIDNIENKKYTMGMQINDLKELYNFTEKLMISFDSILKKRNYLTHVYFKENIEKFSSEIGSKEMIKYFTNFIEESKKIDKELTFYYKNFQDELGITEKEINNVIKKMIIKEKKRDK